MTLVWTMGREAGVRGAGGGVQVRLGNGSIYLQLRGVMGPTAVVCSPCCVRVSNLLVLHLILKLCMYFELRFSNSEPDLLCPLASCQ